MNFGLGMILGFLEFSDILFRTDGKNLSGCKIISSTISTSTFWG